MSKTIHAAETAKSTTQEERKKRGKSGDEWLTIKKKTVDDHFVFAGGKR